MVLAFEKWTAEEFVLGTHCWTLELRTVARQSSNDFIE